MKKESTITILVILIAFISSITAGFGIFSDFGGGAFDYESIRGKTIEIYGKGIYQHMSADVAVQGIDLGLLLPVCFVAGILLLRNQSDGYLYATPYIVFLSILMSALTAKIIAMAMNGVNVIPVIFIIPAINIITILCAYLMIRNIRSKNV